ncbi:MAG TPA: glycosyltransferase [Pyrinomonadaceae bacterium]|nr:glycosyltransferase [Pyrinomonadaceae bacterium]
MPPIKICHLIKPSTQNPLLFDSIKFSDRAKFDYTIITLDAPGRLQEQADELNAHSLSLNKPSRKQLPQTIFSLIRIFRKERFDIVQVHGFEASAAGLPAAILAGVRNRVYSGHHSHEIPLHKNPKLTAVDSFLAARLSTHVIAPSKNMRDIFVETQRVPERKLRVIPHGLDLEQWSAASQRSGAIRRELGIDDGKVVFGAVGRLYWVKGFDTLIRAFAALAPAHPDVVLWIIGEGSERAALENLIRSVGLSDRIYMLGNRADIADVMADLDVLVHPSLAESFGLIFIEAMALGKPVIGTAVGIAPELIVNGENGFVVDAGDESALSAALSKMLDIRATWTKMGESARNSAKRYSVEVTQRECDEFYASLV